MDISRNTMNILKIKQNNRSLHLFAGNFSPLFLTSIANFPHFLSRLSFYLSRNSSKDNTILVNLRENKF
jgi:hypothetical protein